MGVKIQTIKIKEADIKKAVVKGLGRAVWETKQGGRSVREQIHQIPKHKKPKHRKNFAHLEEEF